MSKFRNDFTDQMIILFAIMVPALIGSGIGGGIGFLVSLIIAAPFAVFIARYMNEGTGRRRSRRS